MSRSENVFHVVWFTQFICIYYPYGRSVPSTWAHGVGPGVVGSNLTSSFTSGTTLGELLSISSVKWGE